jgi:chromosome segregation ATPase
MSEERFDRLEQQIRDLSEGTDQGFDSIDRQFETIDHRFETIDHRFEIIDKRFEMIDQRFETIDHRFEMIDKRFDHVETRLDRLETGQGQLESRFDEASGALQGQVRDLQAGQKDLRESFESRSAELKGSFDRLSDDLGRQMRMLHEDVVGRIAATREYSGITRQEFGEYKESIEQRVRPLEVLPTVVREHNAKLRQHDAEIASLKRKRRERP